MLAAPVLLYLVFGDTFREALSASPMDIDVGDDLILGWDWISSHDLRHLYVDCRVQGPLCYRPPPCIRPLDDPHPVCDRPRKFTPTPSRSRIGCAAARPSTLTASSPSFERAGLPPAPGPVSNVGQEPGRASTRLSCCSTPGRCAASRATWCGGAGMVGGRRVAAAGGADALPGEGGGVRRRRPTPRHRAAARARGWTGGSPTSTTMLDSLCFSPPSLPVSIIASSFTSQIFTLKLFPPSLIFKSTWLCGDCSMK